MRALYLLLLMLMIPPALLMLRRAVTGDARRWPERFGRAPAIAGGIEVWVHAASLGEVQAAAPLVDALLARYGNSRVGITTMTSTGSALVRSRWQNRVQHAFIPFDLPVLVKCFLNRWQPRRVVVMESELWPSLFRQVAARGIPLLIANARMSPRSNRRYARLGKLLRDTVAYASAIAAQSEHDALAYRSLGARWVEVTGNLKFDATLPKLQIAAGRRLRNEFGAQRPLWAAVSTHAGEEAAALEAHQRLLQQIPEAALIIVPRHPERFDSVWRDIQASGLRGLRRSSRSAPDASTQVLLGDSMGEMFRYLAAADLVFVGGSLVPIGGHNVLEPAALGLPVLFGTQMDKQKPARTLLLEADGAMEVLDAEQLCAAVAELLADPALASSLGHRAREALQTHQGATQRVLALFDRIATEPAPVCA